MVATKSGRVVATHGDIKSEVNKGLNCVKGYFLSKIMYGRDRLTAPLFRMKNGKYHKEGEFRKVSWGRAFDQMEVQFKKTLRDKGPTAVGMFGSGQWTVWEGYAASKLMKAGFRSNNIDPNARHCMASAVAGFMRTFGMDEPMGCYDDFEHADAFVLWGANMAEMHPILWTRLTDRRLSAPHVKVAVLSTFENRCFELADIPMVFKPQTDLAILNYIANHIIQSGNVNADFVRKHTNFRLGNADIGYGLRPDNPLEQSAKNSKKAGGSKPMTMEEYDYFPHWPSFRGHRVKAIGLVVTPWTVGYAQTPYRVRPMALANPVRARASLSPMLHVEAGGGTAGRPIPVPRGWSDEDVLPIFKRLESFDGGDDEPRGRNGALHLTEWRSDPGPD